MSGDKLTRRSVLASTGVGLAAGLAGCSDDGGNGGSTNGSDSINVGFATFQSGAYSAFGEDNIAAIEMLVDNWNQNGGLQGREINLSTVDTEGEAELAIQRSRQLINQDNVDFYGCFLSTPEARGAINVAGRNEVPLLTCSTGARLLVEEACNPYAFRGPTSTLSKGKAGAPVGLEEFGTDVVQLNPDYSWGQEIAEDWGSVIEDNGGTVVDSLFAELGGSDFSTEISAIEDADPDWIQVGFAGSGAVAFMTQADQQGLEYPQFHHVLYEQTVQGASEGLFQNVDVFTPSEYNYQIDTDANQQFVQDFNDAEGRNPSLSAGNVYRHMEAGFKAIDAADGFGADEIVSAIEGWSGDVISGGYEMRACDHQGEYPVYISQVENVQDGVSWSNIQTVDTSEMLLSCDEQTSRMNCSVE